MEKYIKMFEDFNNKSIPELIKKISYIIRKDISNNGDNYFYKNYNIDNINIDIKINYKKGLKSPYYSNVNIYDVINGVEPILIQVNIQDDIIDINYLMSVISHEIRHIYDIYTISDDVDILDFVKSLSTVKFKNTNKFVDLVYLSLEHELIARHNMLYEMFRWINITDKNKLFEIFKDSYVYKALIMIGEFNSDGFISKNHNLNNFTLEFSKSIDDEFDGDLKKYYKKWEIYFHKKSNEFLSYVDSMLDDIISDINNNRVYERLCGYISYNENIGNNVSKKIFDDVLYEKNDMRYEKL